MQLLYQHLQSQSYSQKLAMQPLTLLTQLVLLVVLVLKPQEPH